MPLFVEGGFGFFFSLDPFFSFIKLSPGQRLKKMCVSSAILISHISDYYRSFFHTCLLATMVNRNSHLKARKVWSISPSSSGGISD